MSQLHFAGTHLSGEAGAKAHTRVPVVALATSDGAIDALSSVLGALPADFAAAVIAIARCERDTLSRLIVVLSQATPLAVRRAEHGEAIRSATVYLAPTGRHLLVNRDGTLGLSDASYFGAIRPSADALLESMAYSCGARTVAVLLTSQGFDGAEGAEALIAAGGMILVWEVASSRYAGIALGKVNRGKTVSTLPQTEIAPMLIRLVKSMGRHGCASGSKAPIVH
jgi:two-component system chemotaxis response regulator CheB